MNRFKMILSFFSTIPVKNVQFIEAELGKGIRLLPIVGLLFGVIIIGLHFLLNLLNVDASIQSFFILVCYVFITGGLHLDGVADTSDGIFSHRSKERILEIMKDSRVGTFGVISLIIVLLGDWLFILKSSMLVIFLFPIVGRCIALFTCRISTYARKDGFGSQFIMEAKHVKSLAVLVISVGLICALSIFFNQIELIPAILLTFICVGMIVKKINQKIDGITGDVIGFSIEISQLIFLAFVTIGDRLL